MTLLKAAGVSLAGVTADPKAPTGVALIAVGANGENQIVVCPGANERFTPDLLGPTDADAVICQLEIPVATVLKAAETARGFFAVNLAPALAVPDALLARADLLRAMGRNDQALMDLERLRGLDPDDAQVLWREGAVLLVLGRPADARSFLARAVEIAPDEPEARFWHGSALAAEGRHAEALDELERGLALAPDHERAYLAHYGRAQSLAALARHAEALAAIDAALEALPEHVRLVTDTSSLHDDRARMLDALGRGAEADAARAWAAELRDLRQRMATTYDL
jgi:tetratricopeptide (TPR) repeat protein